MFDDELEAVNSFFPDRAVKPFDILSVIQYQDNRNSDLGKYIFDKPDATAVGLGLT